MKRVLKTLAIHLFCIIFFAFFYYYFSIHFDNNKLKHNNDSKLESLIDFLLFSTTIQAGVGISDILPISIYGKLLMILQQLIMICIGVITIYVFTK
jgi:dolichyl-phosphate-mannose--protein O-mannosyl transferase